MAKINKYWGYVAVGAVAAAAAGAIAALVLKKQAKILHPGMKQKKL